MAIIRDLLGHGIYDDLSAVFVGIASRRLVRRASWSQLRRKKGTIETLYTAPWAYSLTNLWKSISEFACFLSFILILSQVQLREINYTCMEYISTEGGHQWQ